MSRITITRPDDWHLHLRDGEHLRAVLPDTARRFARAIVMPNLKPPVTTTDMALSYRERILAALPAGAQFEPLMTLYLTDNTPPGRNPAAPGERRGARGQVLSGGRDHQFGLRRDRSRQVRDALEAMEERGMPLLVHGEVTDPDVDVFDRERVFIERVLVPLLQRFAEAAGRDGAHHHREAVRFVAAAPPRVAATITAHHLLLNRNALFAGGIRPHHYCLPVLKREDHRQALIAGGDQRQSEVFSRHRQRAARAPHQGGRVRLRRASTPRTPASSSTPRRSARTMRSTSSKVSPAFSARISTACRATGTRSRWSRKCGTCPRRCRFTTIRWCRSAPVAP